MAQQDGADHLKAHYYKKLQSPSKIYNGQVTENICLPKPVEIEVERVITCKLF